MFTYQTFAYILMTTFRFLRQEVETTDREASIVGLQPLFLVLGVCLVYKSYNRDYMWLVQPALLTLIIYTLLTIFLLNLSNFDKIDVVPPI